MQSGIREMTRNPNINLEQKLANMLKPVTPSPEFINSLKTKLTYTPSVIMETSKKNVGLVLFGAGLFAGAAIFGIIHFIKRLKK